MTTCDFAPELAALLKFSGDVAGAIRMYSNYNPQAQHGYIHEERRDPSLFGADLMYLSGAITQMLEVGAAVELGEPTHIAEIARAVARMFASEYAAPGHEGAKAFAFWTRLVNLPAAIEALESLANKAERRDARPVALATAHVEPEPLFLGTWHHGQGNLCCGTMRYMRADFDTQPAPEIRTAIFDWICSTMNAATDKWRKQRRALENNGAQLPPRVRPALQRFATPADANLSPLEFVAPDASRVGAMKRPELIFSLSDLAPLAQHALDAVGLRFGDDTIDDPHFHKGGVVTLDDHGGPDISNIDSDKLGPALILRPDLALMSNGLPAFKLPEGKWQHVVFPKAAAGQDAIPGGKTFVGMPAAVLDALTKGMTELVVDLARMEWSLR